MTTKGFTTSRLSVAITAIQEMLKQYGDGYLFVDINGRFCPVIKMQGIPGSVVLENGKDGMAVIIEIGDPIDTKEY